MRQAQDRQYIGGKAHTEIGATSGMWCSSPRRFRRGMLDTVVYGGGAQTADVLTNGFGGFSGRQQNHIHERCKLNSKNFILQSASARFFTGPVRACLLAARHVFSVTSSFSANIPSSSVGGISRTAPVVERFSRRPGRVAHAFPFHFFL